MSICVPFLGATMLCARRVEINAIRSSLGFGVDVRVRAVVLGSCAIFALCATSALGVAKGGESTTTVRIEEAGISVSYPASWTVVTDELAKNDIGRYTTRFAASVPQPDPRVPSTNFVVSTEQVDDHSASATELSLRAFRDEQRSETTEFDERFLGVSKQMVGGEVAYRSDRGREDRFLHLDFSTRTAELAFEFGADRDVFVTVHTRIGKEGKAMADRILRSVKAL